VVYKNDDTLFMGGIRSDQLSTIAEFMGYDIDDPVQLQGFVQDIAAKIKGAFQKARGKRDGQGVYAVSTPSGTLSLSEAGKVSAVTPKPAAVSPKARSAGILNMLQENPLLVLAAGAVIFFVLSKKR
jgi:hypothetical protein